jgi:hypothetical protein
MTRRYVEQRVTRLDEIGAAHPDGRRQRGMDVDAGLGRRGCAAGAERGEQQQQCGQRGDARARALLLLAALLAGGCALFPGAPAPAPAPAETAAAIALDPSCPRIAQIVVHKRERRLVAHCDPGPAIVMNVALGRDPAGPKRASGDRRTPEGSYTVSGPASKSRFHRFIPIAYPSREDADAALASGLITRSDHARIVARHRQGRPPPQDTALGGGLGFHGEGPRWRGDSADVDWTLGCIAVRDHEIDFLAERVTLGTPVRIEP